MYINLCNCLVVDSYNGSMGRFEGNVVPVTFPKNMIPRRHMHVKPAVKSQSLDGRIERFQEKFSLESAFPTTVIHEETDYVGRIVNENEGKMNEKSILLEFSKGSGSGIRVPLDFGECPQFSVFPGQIVHLKGTNPDGQRIRVTRQLAFPVISQPPTIQQCKAKIMVAAGPFVRLEGLDFTPLERVLQKAVELRATFVLLIGPFVPADHPFIRDGLTNLLPEEIVQREVVGRVNRLKVPVCLVPSLQDVFHDNVFPQPFFYGITGLEKSLSNPGCFQIDQLLGWVTSVDVLMSLANSEVCRVGNEDRLARLFGVLLEQNSIFPLSPTTTVNLDYSCLEQLEFDQLPHLVIVPSALRFCAKTVNGVLFVNPGHLCKSSGTCALISLNCSGGSLESQVDFYQQQS